MLVTSKMPLDYRKKIASDWDLSSLGDDLYFERLCEFVGVACKRSAEKLGKVAGSGVRVGSTHHNYFINNKSREMPDNR